VSSSARPADGQPPKIEGEAAVSEIDLAERIRRLEDTEAIRQLVARYGYVIDNRDLPAIAPLFARDGVFRSRDGVMHARGREAVAQQFVGRFSQLGLSIHWTHDHVVWLDPVEPDRATGLVSSHAELVRNGVPMLTAFRYEDTYKREDGAWRFADRLLSFWYYGDVRDYPEMLGAELRMRAYGDRRRGDLGP
jgi:ketosteroid isomerase-like protein